MPHARQSAQNLRPVLLSAHGNGVIKIVNSAHEQALVGTAAGRRNYLFDGAGSGGELGAAIRELIGMTKEKESGAEA